MFVKLLHLSERMRLDSWGRFVGPTASAAPIGSSIATGRALGLRSPSLASAWLQDVAACTVDGGGLDSTRKGICGYPVDAGNGW